MISRCSGWGETGNSVPGCGIRHRRSDFSGWLFIVRKNCSRRAEPILRARVLQTLSAAAHGKVRPRGFRCCGRQWSPSHWKRPRQFLAPPPPTFTSPASSRSSMSGHSRFQSLAAQLVSVADGHRARSTWMVWSLNIPPKGGRQEISHWRAKGSRASILFDQIDCEDVRLGN